MNGSLGLPPFPSDYRASGILLHVTSLPSGYGIGDFGPAAISWIDLLSHAGQSWWQILPIGPTGYGNSPYQPVSSFALNPLLISPDWLVEDELAAPQIDAARLAPFPAAIVDYDTVLPFKNGLLDEAWNKFCAGARADLRPAFEQFCREQQDWLPDYALFQTLKLHFNNVHYLEWPPELLNRTPAAIDGMRRTLANRIGQACFAQFLLFRQLDRLKMYAHSKGVYLIGDMPFFVSSDSSDIWANPELFLIDERHQPEFVAGVPPDYFSAQGQLWGNPLYNWAVIRHAGYRWWIDRLRALLTHVDVIRLDHFRGFAAAWHVPAGAPTAQSGQWVPGPGADFLRAAQHELGALPFIAEDLGMITPDVYELRDEFHLPGMRILQFAFDDQADNPYLPENYVTNTVAFTGTHDNAPTREWFENLTTDEREKVSKYLEGAGTQSADAVRGLMQVLWSSMAALAIAPVQDVLNLGAEARMNVPGHPEGNWRWRCTHDMLTDSAWEWLRSLTKNANRSKMWVAETVTRKPRRKTESSHQPLTTL